MDLKLTINYDSKQYKTTVQSDQKVGDFLEKFISENKIDNSEKNIRLIGQGKFLDLEKTFKELGIEDGIIVKVYKSKFGANKNNEKKNTSNPNNPNQFPPNQQTLDPNNFNPNIMNQNFNPNMSPNNFNPNMNLNPNMSPNMNPNNFFPNSNFPPGTLEQFSNMSPSQLSLQLDMIMNDQNLLDLSVKAMIPNASEQERETFKQTFIENIKRMKSTPGALEMTTNQVKNMASQGIYPGMGAPNMPFNNPVNPMNNANQGYNPMNNVNQGYNQGFTSPMMGQNLQYPRPGLYQDPLSGRQFPMSNTTPCSHGYYPIQVHQMLNQELQTKKSNKNLTDEEAEQKFSSQLSSLNEMGYTNKKKNLKALKECNGDLHSAINYILDNVGED